MVYVLGIAALAMPTILIVQTLRGRVRPTCCAASPAEDARLREVDSA